MIIAYAFAGVFQAGTDRQQSHACIQKRLHETEFNQITKSNLQMIPCLRPLWLPERRNASFQICATVSVSPHPTCDVAWRSSDKASSFTRRVRTYAEKLNFVEWLVDRHLVRFIYFAWHGKA